MTTRRPEPADLITSARAPEVLEHAVKEAGGLADGRAGPVAQALVDRYASLSSAPAKRDPGAVLRTKIIALLDSNRAHDIDLYRRALRTREVMPPTNTEVAAPLRAAALVALAHADSDLAGYEAVIHLSDVDEMTGEPAVTAIRVLGALGVTQPLYALVLGDGGDELAGEALRHLTSVPRALLDDLFQHVVVDEARVGDSVLVGLVDLVLAHADEPAFRARLIDLVATRGSEEVVQYAATAMVAARKEDAFRHLESHAEIRRSPARAAVVAQVRELW